MTPALTARDLQLEYQRVPVVMEATVALLPGRVTALVGPNGSGKSTLLRALARLHQPAEGRVELAGGRVASALSAKAFAQQVTLLTQTRPTPEGVSVRDVVGYGRHPHRSGWQGDDPGGPEAVARAMAVTGVTHMADRGIDQLSGGELQRVWLATCLAQDTGVLLLDEPTTFLDLRYQVEILDLVRDLADERGVAVGVVLHDLDQAAAVADHIVLLHEGRIMAAGAPRDVLTSAVLSRAYGIHVEVSVGPDGRLDTRPVGRHTARATAAVR